MEITATTNIPPGPTDRFDLNIKEDSFEKVGEYIKRYGDFVKIHAVSRKADSYLLNHPEYIKHVLVNNHQNYIKGVGFERIKLLLGNGLITSDGDFWRAQRRMVQPAFHKTVLNSFSEIITRHNQLLLAEWTRKSNLDESVNVTFDMSDVTLNIILETIFGKDLDRMTAAHGSNPFAILTEDTTRDVQLAVKFRQLMQLIKDVIRRRQEEKEDYPDFLGMFMATRTESGVAMTERALLDELMTLIVAGHETTAGTLNWIWYLLSQHPSIEARFHSELDQFEVNDIQGFDQSRNLDYSRKLIHEALRIYPSVWFFSRRAIKEDTIGGYRIPAGADIFISPYYLHRHSKFWGEPEKFDPENFSDQMMLERNRFAYIPFSAGPRRCIGDQFSIYEMLLHLFILGKKVKLRYQSTLPVEISPGMNLRSKHDLLMQVSLR